MSDSKKNNEKKINIKNKKTMEKKLNNKSTLDGKNKKSTTKKKTKAPTKKVANTTKRKTTSNIALENENQIIAESPKKKTRQPREKQSPSSVKQAFKKESIKKNKKIQKREITASPKKKKETAKKKEEKVKLELPKEWKKQPTESKNSKTKPKELTQKLKDSIFEDIDEQTFTEEKKKNKENLKKNLIIVGCLLIIAILGIFILLKISDKVRKGLKAYPTYEVGQKVTLKDNSVWYVIEQSKSDQNMVKLLKETQIDINKDGKYDDNDKKKYNSANQAIYNIEDEGSVAYYLEQEYKKELSEKVGNIESISLITSKEFVAVRNQMGFGYEWSEGNWLGSSNLGTWWLEAYQNNKVYSVLPNGSYKLSNASQFNYVRPVITIHKDLVTKKD